MNLALAAALLLSVLLSLLWNVIALWLMHERVAHAFEPGWLSAAIVAGVVTGWFTVWSRRRNDGDERFRWIAATYYLGILVYWLTWFAITRVSMCVRHGGWTDFDLHDHLLLAGLFLLYGTIPYGVVLLPLCWLSRGATWWAYSRFE